MAEAKSRRETAIPRPRNRPKSEHPSSNGEREPRAAEPLPADNGYPPAYPDHNHFPCPEDIFISPGQNRRLGPRSGAFVARQNRPPKENERFFALLPVEAINYNDPDLLTQKVVFDDLTPLHPDKRLILETEPADINMRVMDLVTPIGRG